MKAITADIRRIRRSATAVNSRKKQRVDGWRTQMRVLTFVHTYRNSVHVSPTMREIGDGVAIRSTSSVAYAIGRLLGAGLLTAEMSARGRILPRTLRLTDDGKAALIGMEDDQEKKRGGGDDDNEGA